MTRTASQNCEAPGPCRVLLRDQMQDASSVGCACLPLKTARLLGHKSFHMHDASSVREMCAHVHVCVCLMCGKT
jgi:hypothetical protein